ncbi:11757_t:CDS:2 [Entrophospora sp. SA101]|nr:11757_t:CDS:2 [Entrophospora sp. SA101]
MPSKLTNDVDDILSLDYNTYEFESEKFQIKISDLIKKYKGMRDVPKMICDNIKHLKLDSNDLISNGVICNYFLEQDHKKIYRKLVKESLCRDFIWNDIQRKTLQKEEKDLINNFLYNDKLTSSNPLIIESELCLEIVFLIKSFKKIWKSNSYQKEDPSINERTYSHDIANVIVKFILYNIDNIEMRWDGCSCQSTDNRNNIGGPKKFPDFFCFNNEIKDHDFDLLFGEISHGPFVNNNTNHQDHVIGDLKRLGKFAKDSYNHDYYFFKSEGSDYKQLHIHLDQLVKVMIHLHETEIDFYIFDRYFYPFYRICEVETLSIPLFSDIPKTKFSKFVQLCETLLNINNIMLNNIIILNKLNPLLNLSQSTPPHQIRTDETPEMPSTSNSLFITYNS